jgi:hypothetical protein
LRGKCENKWKIKKEEGIKKKKEIKKIGGYEKK